LRNARRRPNRAREATKSRGEAKTERRKEEENGRRPSILNTKGATSVGCIISAIWKAEERQEVLHASPEHGGKRDKCWIRVYMEGSTRSAHIADSSSPVHSMRA